MNSSLVGFFQASRGLKQDDPLSPTLFIHVIEVFSRGIHGLIAHNSHMHFSSGGCLISHLPYIDDMVILTKANDEGLYKMLYFLEKYQTSLGQLINFQKALLLFPIDWISNKLIIYPC